METFGKRLYLLRKNKELKVCDAAKYIGISIQAWTDYEKNRTMPQVDKLVLISKYFGVSTDFLLFGSENINPPTITDKYSSYLICLMELIKSGLFAVREELTIHDNVILESKDDYVKMFLLSYLRLKKCASSSFTHDDICDMAKSFSEKFKIKI